MPNRSFTIAFKKEVFDFIDQTGGSVFKATKQFETLSCIIIYGWYINEDKILATSHAVKKRRVDGGGGEQILMDVEPLIYDETVELRLKFYKVTRAYIVDCARLLAEDH